MKTHKALILLIILILVLCGCYALWPNIVLSPLKMAGQFAPGSSTTVSTPSDAVTMPMNIVSIREVASTSPAVTVEYPQFPSLSTGFNAEIASSTLSRLAEFRQEAADNQAARLATDPLDQSVNGNLGGNTSAPPASAELSPSDYSFIASWQPAQMNGAYVSFVERYDSFVGGANEIQDIQTFNYDVADQRTISLADLFPNAPDYLQQISTNVRQQLADSMNAASNGNVSTDMLDAGTAPTADDLSDFTFTQYEITLYFPKCAVAACSFGEQQATIVRSEVKQAGSSLR